MLTRPLLHAEESEKKKTQPTVIDSSAEIMKIIGGFHMTSLKFKLHNY